MVDVFHTLFGVAGKSNVLLGWPLLAAFSSHYIVHRASASVLSKALLMGFRT